MTGQGSKRACGPVQSNQLAEQVVITPSGLFASLRDDKVSARQDTGQNALSQVRVFTEAIGCDGLIITKLDGTAKGGVVIAMAEELGVQVDFVGIGEGIDDLQRFSSKEFAEALFS